MFEFSTIGICHHQTLVSDFFCLERVKLHHLNSRSKAKLLAHGEDPRLPRPRGHVLTGSRKKHHFAWWHDDSWGQVEWSLKPAYTHPYSGSLPGTLKLPFSQVWVECPWGPAWVGPWVVCPAWVTSTWAAQIQGSYLKILVFEENFHCKLRCLSLPSSLTYGDRWKIPPFLDGRYSPEK